MITMLTALAFMGTPTWEEARAAHAHHDVSIADDQLVVESRWSTGAWVHASPRIELAVPLPADAELTGAEPERSDDGSIVALVFDGGAAPHTRVSVPLDEALADGDVPIPVLEDGGVQRVSLDAALTFRPDAGLGMVTHLGHHVATELAHDERRAVDRQLRAAPLGSYYVTVPAIVRAHGLHGALFRSSDVRHRSAIGVALIFVIVAGAGAFAYRRSRAGAEAERAEQVLAAEFDGLERDSP